MPRRHRADPADPASIAARLDERVSAHSAADPFEEVLALLVARAAQTSSRRGFLSGADPQAERLEGLREAARRWPTAATLVAPSALPADALREAGALLAGFEPDPTALSAAFEHLASRADRAHKGQFFTPSGVAGAMAALLAPAPGERVLDPACGAGGLLLATLAREPAAEVWGFDLDPRAARLARLGLELRGLPGQVFVADSLARSEGALEACLPPKWPGFDAVIANPPFAGDRGAAEGYALAQSGRAERELLFLERCIGLLRPGGRFALVLPHSALGSRAAAPARRWLLQQARVVGVVGLHRDAFQPHTGQKAAIVLGLRRARPRPPDPSEEIGFFVSERAGVDPRGRPLRAPDGAPSGDDLGEAVGGLAARLRVAAREEAAWA